MKICAKRVLPILLSVLICVGVFSGMAFSSSADEPAQAEKPFENIEGGLVLHCWCWSFNSIKENIPKIAEAGYSAIQTSPINKVLAGDNGGMQLYGNGKWYYQYQPTGYTIGNYQLGTEDEFKEMCQTAHEYGVKVIVDVVANHTTPQKNAVDPSLQGVSGGLYHNYDGSKNADSRKSMTQWYAGLPDTNTQNKNYQNIILNFLKKAVEDGADGFRYDTAKHIELPDDDKEFASDFWPTVLENGSVFQYGEVLQGANSASKTSTRFADYSKIMHVTASSYGYTLRKYLDDTSGRVEGAVASGITAISNYSSETVSDDRLITWVESHDTYANGDTVYNPGVSSYWLTNEQIRRGWALIAARGGTTSLFFSRPEGSSPSDNANRVNSTIWGTNKIGNAGDGNYFDPEVIAVNKFHNAMASEPSALNSAGTKAQIIVTRGDKGAVVVNSAPTDLTLTRTVTMADGTYTDLAHGTKYAVYQGKLYGTVKAGQIAVLYNDGTSYSPEVDMNIVNPPTEPVVTEPVPEPTQAPTEAKTTITLAKSSASLYVKQTAAIKATVKNSTKSTTYTSSNKKIATVSASGKVTAVKKGSAVITVKNNGVSKQFKVTVKNPKLNKTKVSVKVKKTFKLKVTGLVGKAKFKTSSKKIAKVSSKGVITGVKKGKTTITVTANGVKLKVSVTVKK